MSPIPSHSIGQVAFVNGHVTAISLGAVGRKLNPGDALYANEVLRSGEHAAALVAFTDGSRLELGPSATVTLDPEVYEAQGTGEQEEAISSHDAIQAAIAAGGDPAQLLEATAAGGDVIAEPKVEGGLDAVQVARLDQQVNPEHHFDTEGLPADQVQAPTIGPSSVEGADSQFLGAVINAHQDQSADLSIPLDTSTPWLRFSPGDAPPAGAIEAPGVGQEVIYLAELLLGSSGTLPGADGHVVEEQGRLLPGPSGFGGSAGFSSFGGSSFGGYEAAVNLIDLSGADIIL